MQEIRQERLPLPARPREDAPQHIVENCASLMAAVRLMIVSSGFDDDQVGYHLGYSPSHWSEILNGKKNLPWPKLEQAMDFCQSDIPLFYFAHKRGYDRPHKKKNELEIELELLRQELEEERKEKTVMLKILKAARG